MGYILPLYQRHPIFNFLDPKKTASDSKMLKESFESNDVSKLIQLLKESDKKLEAYLEQLLKVRRLKLFNTEREIPDERTKIDEYARAGNETAIEIEKILDCRTKLPRTWPIPEIERQMQTYTEWKKTPKMEEQAFDYVLYNALKEIYFPQFFFEQRIFKLEEEYKGFKYDFLDILGSEMLYLSYLIYLKRGTEKIIDNLQDFIINRYIPKPTFGIDAISLLHLCLWGGNDVNRCNRFFTRRMKKTYTENLRSTCI